MICLIHFNLFCLLIIILLIHWILFVILLNQNLSLIKIIQIMPWFFLLFKLILLIWLLKSLKISLLFINFKFANIKYFEISLRIVLIIFILNNLILLFNWLTFKLSLTYQVFFPLLIYNLFTQLINLRFRLHYHWILILFLFLHGFTCLLGPPHLLEIIQSWYRSVLVENWSELCWLLLIFDFKMELGLWLRGVYTLYSKFVSGFVFIIY